MNKKVLVLLVCLLLSMSFIFACKAQPGTTSAPTSTAPTTSTPTTSTPTTSTPTTSTPTTTVPTSTAPTTTAPQIDILNVGLISLSPEALDVAVGSLEGLNYRTAMFEPLVGLELDGKTFSKETGIAEDWQTPDNGKTWIFTIRKGVQFHNNWGEVTAEDVAFSINRMMSNDSTYARKTQVAAVIAGAEAVGPYQVKVTSVVPSSWMPFYMSWAYGENSDIVPKKYFDQMGWDYAVLHPIGTGPYQFSAHVLGQYIECVAVPYKHWLYGVPTYKKVRFISVPTETTRLAMFKTGSLDVVQVSLDKAKEMSQYGRVVLQESSMVAGGFLYNSWLPMMKDGKPMPTYDIRVRQALSLAIDRKAINEALFAGLGRLQQLLPGGKLALGYDPSIDIPDPYDPAKAKQLLAEAGYSQGFELTILSTPMGLDPGPLNEVLASYWSAIGVKVQIVTMDYGAFKAKWADPKAPGSWDDQAKPFWVLCPSSDPFNWASRYALGFSDAATSYHCMMPGPDLSAKMAKLAVTDYGEEYKALFREIEKGIIELHQTMGIVAIPTAVVVNDKVPKAYEVGRTPSDFVGFLNMLLKK